ncbi:MAG: DUF2752 domain-containing protein [Armatimonas sp.]
MKRLLPAAPYLVILLLSVLLPLPDANGRMLLPPICAFKNLTGLPCPGCGLTRSFVCLGHGHIAEAFHYHILGPALFLGILSAAVLMLIRIKHPHFLTKWRLDFPILISTAVVLLLLWPLRLMGWLPPLPE